MLQPLFDSATHTIATIWADSTVVNQLSDQGTSSFAYAFQNVHAPHLLSATFVPLNIHYTITVRSAPNGKISPPEPKRVNYGDSAHFDVIANPGYRIQDILADNRSVFSTNRTPDVRHIRFLLTRRLPSC